MKKIIPLILLAFILTGCAVLPEPWDNDKLISETKKCEDAGKEENNNK